MVPDPPASEVPPITPAATARNMIWLPPACGSIERNAKCFQDAGEARQRAGEHEIADLQPVDIDAGLAGPGRVGAGGRGVQAPAHVAQHHMHDGDDEQRPQDLAVAPGAHDLRQQRPSRRAGRRAAEIVSVKPLTRNSVPSVVTKDGIDSSTVTTPLTRPTDAGRGDAQDHGDGRRNPRLRRRNTSRTGRARTPCRRTGRSRP